MAQETVVKTVHQYNKETVPTADMEKLTEIAEDYSRVKNYVYQRYGGIYSLPKIYPGYTVQNEMTESGLRAQLEMPSVYFYCAIFDALGDIKSQWSHTKSRVEKNIKENQELTHNDRHYLRFVIKQSQCFEAILMGKEPDLKNDWQEGYDNVRTGVDERRLQQYLRRQVRRHLPKLHTDTTNGFTIPPRGYRYGNHGIYVSTKENRKRVFILLTDANQYNRQLHIQLYPAEGKVKIDVPIDVKVKNQSEYCNEIGLAVGMTKMFVTDKGNVYGDKYGIYQTDLTEYVSEGLTRYRKNSRNNPGRKKYNAGKEKLEAALHSYVNAEINRMLETEKPKVIYIPKLPRSSKAGVNKKINNAVSMWQRGYIKSRLTQKCMENSIKLVEVLGKDISNECSNCGNIGIKTKDTFTCNICGLQLSERDNAAMNALKRGRAIQ